VVSTCLTNIEVETYLQVGHEIAHLV